MKKIGYALLGCGAIGKLHAGVIDRLPNGYLAAVCSRNVEVTNQMKEKYGCKTYQTIDEMLKDDDVEVVSVCLPSSLHRDAVIACAKAKKHVVCEKPIDISQEKGQEMVDICNEYGVTFGVIFQHRFDEAVLAVEKAVKEGKFGKLLWGASRTIWYRDDVYYSPAGRGTWEADGGGALMIQAIHYIDLLTKFFGQVKSVNGKCRTMLHHNIEVEDVGVANVEFKNGCVATIEGSTACYPGLYAELALFGEKGTAIIRNDHLLFYQLDSGKDASLDAVIDIEKASAQNLSAAVADDSHYRQFADFTDAIIEGRRPAIIGADALHSVAVINAIYESSDKKKEIYL
ncbi:MAG: Gfo/Idh/MocA family oxidoreductase [Eubacteriales bacterium]